MQYSTEVSDKNPNILTINTRRRLTKKAIIHCEKGDPQDTKEVLPLRVVEVRGVKEVFVGAYDMQIEKASLFSWDELTPRILEVLQNRFKRRQRRRQRRQIQG